MNIHNTIHRIKFMEQLLDEIQEINQNTPEIIASGDGFPRFRPRLGSWMENYLRNRGGDLEKGSKKC